jgi:4-amino-4-deoxy-L-arabinose transferase-like glycosyltransferase
MTQTAASGRNTGALQALLLSVATAILLFSLLVYFVYAANLIAFPFDYDQGEGFELVDTILFSQFEWPYRSTDAFPFYSSNYPPLFHVMLAPFVWLFGEAYWYGRLISFLGTLLTAGVIAYAVQREGRHGWVALLAGLAFLASNTVYHIGPLVRQHMTMVLFETLAIVLLARSYTQQQTRLIALGLFLLICAGYTKQLAAISAVSVLAWMILRNPRRGILWGAGFALVGGLIFAWLTLATGGEWWRQAILANVNQFDPFQTRGLFALWWQLHGFLILPATLLTLYELYFDRLSLYAVWFVFATVLGGIGSGTWGAGDSYFATSIAAMCILSGIFAARILNSQTRKSASLQLIVPVLYIGYGIATLHMPTDGAFAALASVLNLQANTQGAFYDSASYDVVGYANIGHLTTQADIDAGYRIVDAINATDGPVLSEEAGFVLAAGREVITNPTQLRNLWLNGLWQAEGNDLIAMIEAREFGLVILRAQFYPVPVLEALGQNYAMEETETVRMNGFNYLLLRPSSNAAGQPAS